MDLPSGKDAGQGTRIESYPALWTPLGLTPSPRPPRKTHTLAGNLRSSRHYRGTPVRDPQEWAGALAAPRLRPPGSAHGLTFGEQLCAKVRRS